jgi:hypothetical protein
MKTAVRLLVCLGALIGALSYGHSAKAVEADLFCVGVSGLTFSPCGNAANPIYVTGTLTPSGTFNVDVTKWGAATLGDATAVGTEASGNVPTVNAHVTSPLVAGSANIGKVGIDQTTPGTTNGVTIVASNAGIHDCSASITTGGTAQQLISAVQNVHGFLLEVGVNDSNTDPIYFSGTTTTPGAGVAGSFSLNPSTTTSAGGSFASPLNYPVGMAIYVNGATTGDKIKCNYF